MRDLMNYLPENYSASPETIAIQEAIQPELDMLWEYRNSILRQLDPRTATWGLQLWEAAFGLPTDESKDIEFRRTRLVAKIRGSGTTTVELIKSVAESFSNGEVEAEEFPRENRVEIRFVSETGTPPNLDDLKDALREILPAHLQCDYVIYYTTHAELQPYTHGQLAAFTHNAIREGDLTNNGN